MKKTDQLYLKFPEPLAAEIRQTAERDERKFADHVRWLVRLGLIARRVFYGKARFGQFRQELLAAMGV